MILAITIVLKKVDLSWLSVNKGLFQISKNAWSIILFLIIACIITLIIDMWVISGDTFKEFSFLSAKLVKEETKKALQNLETNVELLERNINAFYHCNEDIKFLFKDNIVKNDIENNSFDFIENFRHILLNYYKYSQLDITLDVKLVSITENIQDKIEQYNILCNLNNRNIKFIKKNLESLGTVSLTKNDCMIMFNTYKVERIYNNNFLLVVIKSKEKEIFSRFDEYMIHNMLTIYEQEFWNTSMSIYIDDLYNGGDIDE